MKLKHRQNPGKNQIIKSDKNILYVTIFFLLVFIGLIGYLIYFNVTQAENIINNPYNKRQEILANKTIRGSILASDGTVLATTITDADGNETRYYPKANLLAHVIGYTDRGGSGLENQLAYYLLTSDSNLFIQIRNDISGKKNNGNNAITTLDAGLSQIAYEAMDGNKGSVVIMEPDSGRILTIISSPDFNPNTINDEWDSIVGSQADSPLLNRATQGVYPPGSTFKIITLLEYIRENPENYMDYRYVCDGEFELGSEIMACSGHKAHGEVDLIQSLALSCNGSFINMGLSLDITKFEKTAQKMLFDSSLPLSMEYNKSRFELNGESHKWEIAQTSFGQGKTLVTPVHLALITSAIANDGVLMKPYLVDRIESIDGKITKKFTGSECNALMTKEESDFIKKAMEAVVDESFDWVFENCEYDVAAKSGTAQFGTQGYEHSLFMSYSPVDSPEIVVVVVLEGGENLNTHAGLVAKKIYDYYYLR